MGLDTLNSNSDIAFTHLSLIPWSLSSISPSQRNYLPAPIGRPSSTLISGLTTLISGLTLEPSERGGRNRRARRSGRTSRNERARVRQEALSEDQQDKSSTQL